MPTPPASLTTLDFSMRGLTPRWHRTTLPVTLLEASESGKQRSASAVVTPVAAAPAAPTIPAFAGSAAVLAELAALDLGVDREVARCRRCGVGAVAVVVAR